MSKSPPLNLDGAPRSEWNKRHRRRVYSFFLTLCWGGLLFPHASSAECASSKVGSQSCYIHPSQTTGELGLLYLSRQTLRELEKYISRVGYNSEDTLAVVVDRLQSLLSNGEPEPLMLSFATKDHYRYNDCSIYSGKSAKVLGKLLDQISISEMQTSCRQIKESLYANITFSKVIGAIDDATKHAGIQHLDEGFTLSVNFHQTLYKLTETAILNANSSVTSSKENLDWLKKIKGVKLGMAPFEISASEKHVQNELPTFSAMGLDFAQDEPMTYVLKLPANSIMFVDDQPTLSMATGDETAATTLVFSDQPTMGWPVHSGSERNHATFIGQHASGDYGLVSNNRSIHLSAANFWWGEPTFSIEQLVSFSLEFDADIERALSAPSN